jgi:hypothetical protein
MADKTLTVSVGTAVGELPAVWLTKSLTSVNALKMLVTADANDA